MITVTDMKQVKGQWVNEAVEVLEEPVFDTTLQKWTALANAYGMLAIIELSVEPMVDDRVAERGYN